MIYPLVSRLKEQEGIPVLFTINQLRLCHRAYYGWKKSPLCKREIEEYKILQHLKRAHEADPAAGYRILADDICPLLAKDNIHACDNRVWRICNKYDIHANHTNRYHKSSKTNKSPKPSHDDLIRREFNSERPNQKWLTDITEHPTKEGKVYWCGFKDLFSNRIVGHASGSRMTAELVEKSLLSALKARDYPKDVIIHSDRGAQFHSKIILDIIKLHKLKGSMGQVHTCADNAAMESFNSLLQKNVFNQQKVWETRQELIDRINYWINVRYNQERRQKRLNKLTPLEYDLIFGKQCVIL